jgi:hypothetical protein
VSVRFRLVPAKSQLAKEANQGDLHTPPSFAMSLAHVEIFGQYANHIKRLYNGFYTYNDE